LSPKAVNYRENSIVFFKGDPGDKVLILNRGKVSLNYIDIETGQDIHELVKMGEFFGVRSAMGRYPREETAICLEDSTMIALTIPEFEQVVSKNTRVIMKMLRVFSNQLRRYHKRVQSLLVSEEQVSPEEGLYRNGEYYLKTRQYRQALYALRQYLVYYPSGRFSEAATKYLETAEEYLSTHGQGQGPAPDLPGFTQKIEKPKESRELSGTAKIYYDAISLVTAEKYDEALKRFKALVEKGLDEEYTSKAKYEIGRCLFFLKQYEAAIRIFTELVQAYPKHPDLRDALFFIANSNAKIGKANTAKGLYRKLLSMTSESDSLHRKVVKALKEIDGR
jgi:TolA-binding protein